ncbi:MAG: protein translocase subunit SecD [Planctomycetota bacterium]|nr:protein translocase subunit SecD [Planctomycetota bacterium]
MSLDFLSVLFGAADPAAQSSGPFGLPAGVLTLLRVLVAIPLPLFLGQFVANWLRMKEYGWRLGVIFTSIFCAAVVLQAGRINKGVDLKGGVILVYEIDRESLQTEANIPISADKVNWGSLIQALVKRINPAGTKEIVVRRYGDWQVEIIVPEVDPIEIERIKKLIETAGSLEFRIVANERENSDVIAAARDQAQNSSTRRSRTIVGKDNKHIGFWARIGRDVNPESIRPFKVSPLGHIIRNASTGEILDLTAATRLEGQHAVEKYLEGQGVKDIDILMETNDGYDVTGAHLGMCSRGFDEVMQPSVNFAMKGEGIGKMGGLTGSVIPRGQPPFYQLLGIMLDGELLSAPRVMSTISDRGRITGRFTQPEVDFLVGILQAGSLPAAMKKSPISANQIGAQLGDEEIRKGTNATGASLIAVVFFMVYWYRFPGFIACVAMAANLIMTVAIMIPIHAPLTLPGLAGLVLTMGMAVDANVLIYERMREELDRGCALRMAIRNGFDRAWVTILDSNLTTILTALILYVVGTDQLKGFGVTLTLGLCISMFTSVFCSRVAFDICERKGIITRLRFRHFLTNTNFDFMGMRKVVLATSVIIIAVGLAAAVYRGQQIFAVDFLGGSSVTMVLEKPQEERDLRAKLDEQFEELKKAEGEAQQYTLSRVDVAGKPRGTWWKIDSSLKEETQLQEILQSTFDVAHYEMEFDEKTLSEKRETAPADTGKPKSAEAQPALQKPETPVKSKGEAPDQTSAAPESPTAKPAEQPPAETAKPEKAKPGEAAVPETKPAEEKPKESPPAEAKPAETKPAETKPAEAKPAEAKPVEPPAEKPKAEETKADPPATESAKPAEKQPDSSQTELPPLNVYAMIGAGDLLLALADDAEKPATAEAPAKTAPAAEKPVEQPASEKPAEKTAEPAKEKTADPGAAKAPEKKEATASDRPAEKPADATTPEPAGGVQPKPADAETKPGPAKPSLE